LFDFGVLLKQNFASSLAVMLQHVEYSSHGYYFIVFHCFYELLCNIAPNNVKKRVRPIPRSLYFFARLYLEAQEF